MTFLRILRRLKHQHFIFNFVLHYSSIGSSCGTTVIFQLYCPGMQRNPNLLAGTSISVFALKVFSKKIYSTVRTLSLLSLLNFVFVFCLQANQRRRQQMRHDAVQSRASVAKIATQQTSVCHRRLGVGKATTEHQCHRPNQCRAI